jgi:hypothetical protein
MVVAILTSIHQYDKVAEEESSMFDVVIVLTLESSALPENTTDLLIWDRDFQMPIIPQIGWILNLDKGTEEAISVKVDQIRWTLGGNGGSGRFALVCTLEFEDNKATAVHGYLRLKSNSKWVLET